MSANNVIQLRPNKKPASESNIIFYRTQMKIITDMMDWLETKGFAVTDVELPRYQERYKKMITVWIEHCTKCRELPAKFLGSVPKGEQLFNYYEARYAGCAVAWIELISNKGNDHGV